MTEAAGILRRRLPCAISPASRLPRSRPRRALRDRARVAAGTDVAAVSGRTGDGADCRRTPLLSARDPSSRLGTCVNPMVCQVMQIRDGIVEAIGNTPLLRLKRASELTGCTILGKAEFMNPGQSVKDRAALFIIGDAVRSGALRPGGVIVEGTAGNTGIGLALVANALGYRTVIVIPETQSQEKKDTLRLCGAELIEVPAVGYANPNNYVKVSGRLAAELARTEPAGAIWANQFDNVANRRGHVETTGPEIWEQTAGKVDGFICAVGTGGTLAGVGMALKERKPSVRIGIADPMGAALYSYYAHGVLKAEGSSITEGIGQGRITRNLEDAPIDVAYQIPDEELVPIIFDLLEHEGLCLGGSSGINVAGAIRLARDLGPGHVIVTVLADYGTRYQSKLFNPEFLRSKGLPVPAWLERRSTIRIPFE
jgi:cysteine synthase